MYHWCNEHRSKAKVKSENLFRSSQVALRQLRYGKWTMSKNQYNFFVYRDKSIKNVEWFGKRGAHEQLFSKAFLETTRLNNNSRLSKDQGKSWSLFAFCAKNWGSCIADRNFRTGTCIWLMNRNVGCWPGTVLQRYVWAFYENYEIILRVTIVSFFCGPSYLNSSTTLISVL